MKKIAKFTCASLLAVTSISAGILAITQNSMAATSGYSTSDLPTTIDLNDTDSDVIRNYYSQCAGLSGNNLLIKLKQVLSNGQKYYSYDSTSAIWQIYEISDRDWNKSPASSTVYGTYNSSTNKITNYKYGTGSGSSAKNNPYIHALYVNRDSDSPIDAWSNHQQNEGGINREHIWPKSRGFDQEGSGGARGDPMHLWAADGYTNNIHSNLAYGYVDKTKSYTDCQASKNYTSYSISGNYKGTSKTKGSGTVFEPQDSDKGDIARACFYMVARYNNLAGNDNTIGTNNPNLTLTDSVYNASETGTSSSNTSFSMGVLSDLLAWHASDPVDAYEIHRNNLLYTNYTNNRNPFIDFPEWVDYIWGGVAGSAQPATDKINGYNSGSSVVDVTGIDITDATASITVHETKQLTATVSPSNATDKSVTWSSSNTSVVTVSNTGLITGKAEGFATITVTTNDGGFTDTCTVTVAASGGGGGGSGSTQATLYSGSLTEGDYVIYYGGKTLKNTVSNKNRFDYSEVTPSNNVIDNPDSSIVWHIAPNSTYWTIYNSAVSKYAAGNGTSNQGTLISSITDYARWTVTGTSTYEFENKGNVTAGVNSLLRNNNTYGFATYGTNIGGALSLYKVGAVSGVSLSSITTAGQTTEYEVDDTFEYDGTLTAHYSDSSTKTVVPDTVSSPNMSTAGQKTITLSYTDGGVTKSCTYDITVNNKPIAVTDVSLSDHSLTIEEESYSDLTAAVYPIDADNKNVEWFTEDDSIATVSNGRVTGVSIGQTYIIVVTEDGNYFDTCQITVTAKERMLSADTYGESEGEAGKRPTSMSEAYPLEDGLSWDEDSAELKNAFAYNYNDANPSGRSTYTLKLGTGTANGSVVLNLDIENAYITKVVVKAKKYKTDDTTIAVNSVNHASALTSEADYYEFIMPNNSTVSAIVGTSSKRAFIERIDIYYKHKLANQPEIALDETLYNVNEGATGVLDYDIQNADGGVITFASTHTDILTVDNSGHYEAVSIGVASVIVTLTINDTEYFDIAKFVINGDSTVSEALVISDEIGTGKTTEYKVNVTGNVTSKTGDGTSSKNNSVYITDGEGTIQVYFGYKVVSCWSDLVVGAFVRVTGYVQNYKGTAEISSPTIEVSTYTASDFANDLLAAISPICSDYDDITNNKTALQSVWSTLSNSSHYGRLSVSEIAILVSADADEDGTNIERAMAFYDYACKKYNLDQFITGRTVSSNKLYTLEDNGNTTAMMALIALVAGTTISVSLIYYLRKRKKQ